MGLGLAFRCFFASLRDSDDSRRLKRAVDGIKDPPIIKEIVREVMIPQRGAPPPREIIKEVPVEVIREVEVEVVREVIKEVPVEVIREVTVEVIKEVIKEVPVEVIKEVIKEVPVEVIKEVIKEVPVEVIREVPRDVIKEIVREVPVEVVREVIKEVPVEVYRDNPREIIKETIREVPVETVREVVVRIPDAHGPALLLSLLQQDGRLIDFLLENIDLYSDERVGAAAREIHAKCRKALLKYVTLEPVRAEKEGEMVTLGADYDPSAVRAPNKQAMFGTLKHRGWKAAKIDLPPRPNGADPAIVMPAEVEID
jgi:hypothetical protein